MRVMVASRWPLRPGRERAVFSSSLISSPVRYSRGRTAALVGRRGVIVRFSMVGPFLRFTRKPLFLIGAAYQIVRISAINGTTEADPNRRRTGSSPLAGREPLSHRSFSDRPGIAGVANLTDRLLRGVRYSLH